MARTPRVSAALRQVGRDTASPETAEAATWAADQAQYERITGRNTEHVEHPRLERVAPGQQRRLIHIRPSMDPRRNA